VPGARAPTVAYLALGSNLGDRAGHLAFARAALALLPGTRVTGASAVEETAPFGPVPQGPYLNQMLRVETTLSPEVLLGAALDIERQAGRDRATAVRWGPRTLDIDLVLHGGTRLDTPALTLPHPGLADRAFWRRELAELGVDADAALAGGAAGARA
jgi:2-amino-4-hydroxy-6-hydroxymethyldihydropteridine diphosphokinase